LLLICAELETFRFVPVAPDSDAPGPEGLAPRPCFVVGTKLDLHAADDGAELLRLELAGRLPLFSVSTQSGVGIEELRLSIVTALDVVRVYAKPPGRPPDLSRPFVLRRGSTVEDLADAIHHEVKEKLRFAVRFPADAPPLRVARHYELHDKDVLELHSD
jgi:ribosome-interacting GTPase 1